MAARDRKQLLNELRGKRLEDALVEQVNQEKKFAEAEYAAYYRKCKIWYDIYRGIYTQNYHGFRNSISIPYMYSVIQSDVARKVQTILGQFPYVNFESYPPEEEAIARKNELLVGVQMQDMSLYSKAIDFFTTANLYGVGIMREGWRQDRRLEILRVPQYMPNREVLEHSVERYHTYFDGPDAYVVDPLDFYPQPGFRRVQDMTWTIERYWRDWDDLMDQVQAEIAAGDEPSFDMAALKKVEQFGMSADMGNAVYERQGYARNAAAWSNRTQRFQKPVEVWERWGWVPSEHAPDGQRNRKIVIFNGKILAKNIGNPYHHGQKPYSTFSVGDPHFFHGIGKSEILAKMQAATNRIMNHKLDSLDISISPAVIVGANSGLDSSRPLHMTPGKVLQLDTNTVDDSIIRPFPINFQGIQAAAIEVQTLWQMMQQGSGITEDVSTIGTDMTAREYQGKQEQRATRQFLEIKAAEKDWLEPLADRIRALNRQYLSLPKEIHMIGSMAVQDPITGQPIDDHTINYEDLWPDYKARAVGSNQSMLRSTQRQDVFQFLQAASQVPGLMQRINWGNFAREMMETMGFRNVNALLQEMQPGLADQVQELGAKGTLPGPGQPPPEAAPESLSPSGLGHLNRLGPSQEEQ